MQEETFAQMTEDIVCHPMFLQLRHCAHHGGENSLYVHSLDTARCAFRLARRFHLREDRVRAVTRAALLHDFFGYDWHSEEYKHTVRGQQKVTVRVSPADEQAVADILAKDNDQQINTLSTATGIAVGRLAAVTFSLEMKGVVKCRAGGVYHLIKS